MTPDPRPSRLYLALTGPRAMQVQAQAPVRRDVRVLYQWQLGLVPKSGLLDPTQLDAHAQACDRQAEQLLPPNFAGLVVIDYESVGPSFPGARAWYVAAIDAVRRARPLATVGFYGYPETWESDAYLRPAPNQWRALNDAPAMAWFWKVVDFLAPVLYLPDAWTTEYMLAVVRSTIAEAGRVGERLPIYPFVCRFIIGGKSKGAEVPADLTNRIIQTARQCGADGALFWDDIQDDAVLALVQRYLDALLSPAEPAHPVIAPVLATQILPATAVKIGALS